MTYDEVEAVLSQVLEKEWDDLDPPSMNDWEKAERKFNCKFGDEFTYLFILISNYVLPGILNVSTGKNNGNDLITFVYDYEVNNGNWIANMIPFFEIGNGDYFCINAKYGSISPVYYYSSEDFNIEEYNTSFEEWINNLPLFLNGWILIASIKVSLRFFSFAKNYLYDIKETIISFRNRKNWYFINSWKTDEINNLSQKYKKSKLI